MTDRVIPKRLPTAEELKDHLNPKDGHDPWAIHATNELLRVGRVVENQIDRDLGNHGLSLSRHSTLSIIAMAGSDGVSPADVADQLGVTRATMTGLVDGLERDGLVKRQRSESDRRRVSLLATSKGRKLETEMLPDHGRRITEAVRKLTQKDKKELVRLLGLMEAGAGAYTQPIPAKPRKTRK